MVKKEDTIQDIKRALNAKYGVKKQNLPNDDSWKKVIDTDVNTVIREHIFL